jgi:MGT family glycosyltransferase
VRIVFTTWGSLGDLHPFLALGVELRARGHEVSVATMPIWRDNVVRAGLGFHPLRPDVPPGEPDARDVVRRVLDPQKGPEYLFRELFAPHTRETYDDTLAAASGADVLVTHQLPLTGAVVAQKLGIPWVSAVLAPLSFLSAYDPPVLANAEWMQRVCALHPAIARTFFALGRTITKPWVDPIVKLRAQIGLPAGEHALFSGQHSPRCVLALFSRALSAKLPDFPAQTLITGFPFYDAADAQPPDRELLRFLDAGDPPIVFTLGSSAVWVADDFYSVSIEAVKRLGRRALLLAGEEADALRPLLPAGIEAFNYAPHSAVMPRASLVVHQGGVGTTGQALRAGRPMIVVPFGQDQPDNARRCVRLGVARTIRRGRYTVDRVALELSALLDDPAAAERAQRVGEMVRGERGTELACDAIERAGGDEARRHFRLAIGD